MTRRPRLATAPRAGFRSAAGASNPALRAVAKRDRGRVVLPLLAGLIVPAAVAWLAWSFTHLVGSATTYHVRVTDRPPGAAMPTTAVVQQLLVEQNRWGDSVMFAVAAVAAALVLTLVVWLLSGSRRPDRH